MVAKGELRLPNFQRSFVWDIEKASYLWDSIVKGIPINSIILWYSEIKLNSIRSFGNLKVKEPTGKVFYALDGQQRVTTIFGTYEGLSIGKVNFKDIYLNISLNPDEYTTESQVVPKSRVKKGLENNYFSLYEALKSKINQTEILIAYGQDKYNNLQSYLDIIKTSELAVSIASGSNPSVSAEIFTRTNTSGVKLQPYEIMSAILFDNESEFYFNERIAGIQSDLNELNFKFSTLEIFKAISIILEGATDNKTLIGLDKDTVINNWDEIHMSMFNAIDFLKLYFKTYSGADLISKTHFYMLSKFFYMNNGNKPSYKQIRLIEEYMIVSGISGYFATGNAKKVSDDSYRFSKILINERLDYSAFDMPQSLSEYIAMGNFKKKPAVNTFTKTILTILRMKDPKSYSNGLPIVGDNMSSESTVHLHHIFPKSVYGIRSNNIFNLSILDSETNHSINVKNPNNYMIKYSKEPNFNEIIQSHFISNLTDFGIMESNLDMLLEERAKSILSWVTSKTDYKFL